MTHVIRWTAIAVLLTASSGCESLLPTIQDVGINQRNRYWAKLAWKQVEPAYRKDGAGKPLLNDFAVGYRDGYASVAGGSPGMTMPLLPPARYWGAKHQNPTGRDEIASWFSGFEQGMAAAKADGVGYWMEIPTSGGEQRALDERRARWYARNHPPAEQVPPGPPVEPVPEAEPESIPAPEELPPAKTTFRRSRLLRR
ncbi:MAG TPA: hypothetical protein VHV77_01445 [Pirellulales bacterium]|jgi:hypothetical protein|nr:hypothetical protein [Pirellulales bacterium]